MTIRSLLLCLALLAQTPTQLVNEIQVTLDKLRTAVGPHVILTPAEFDAQRAAAAPGAVLTLSPTLVYPTALTLTRSITLQSVVPAGRMDATTPLPTFLDGITIPADDVLLVGLEVRKQNHLTDIVTFSGARVTLDRLRILGDPIAGAKRGVAANGNGSAFILRSYIDDCFQGSPGNDSQAIIAWDMAPGLVIEDNFLRSGSEGVLLGGADSATAERMPTNVTIRGNTITARREWMARPIGIKTRLELKAGRHVVIEQNDVSEVWKQGQGGYLLSLTVRNQGGLAPWSTIEDVTIQDNRFHSGSAAINLLAREDFKEDRDGMPTPKGQTRPSGRLARVTMQRNTFLDLDPVFYSADASPGSTRLVQISAGPIDVTLVANTFAERTVGRFGSTLYFLGAPQAELLVVTGNTWPRTTYGVFGANASAGINPATGLPKAWEQYVRSGTLASNRETP